jgi:hypothetical protein
MMSKSDPALGRSRWGIAFLVGFGLAVTPCLIAAALGSSSQILLQIAVNGGGWLLVFSAIAFCLADPERGIINAFYGASVGALTMALLVGGWTSLGQTLGSIVSGAFLGTVVSVPIGWVVRSLLGRFAPKGAVELEPGPHDLRDPWIDT